MSSKMMGLISAVTVVASGDKIMSCPGQLCGVLVLETGKGTGYYQHDVPTVHGLWPQVSPYGDSVCIAPQDLSPEKGLWVPPCYQGGEYKKDPDHQASFVLHEWTKHGKCAGPQNEDDYFTQICDIATKPIAVMVDDIKAGGDWDSSAKKLAAAGFSVFDINPEGHGQVMLSVCAHPDGDGTYTWHLAAPEQFSSVCGTAPGPAPSPAPSPSPSPSPAPSSDKCVSGQKGPSCKSDADCQGRAGCARCAHSGFCTDVPIEEFLAV